MERVACAKTQSLEGIGNYRTKGLTEHEDNRKGVRAILRSDMGSRMKKGTFHEAVLTGETVI